MPKDNSGYVAEALKAVIEVLSPLDAKDRARVLASVSMFFGDAEHAPSTAQRGSPHSHSGLMSQASAAPSFSDERAPSAKEFLFQKQPKTDIERIACLAYYLTHYQNTPHFKTLDLGRLNTEAAQIKFSNAAYATDNATKAGFLAPASKGQKQITAWGEQFVAALPDRDAAMKAISQARKRKGTRRKR